MVRTQTLKYIILQAVILLLTTACCLYPDVVVFAVALTVQIGLYAAVAAQKPFWLSLLSPVLSYIIAVVMLENPVLAIASVLFFPAGALMALFIRKGLSRSKTVLVTSVTVGAGLLLFALSIIIPGGINSFDSFAEALNNTINDFAKLSVENLPDIYFTQGISEETYYNLLVEMLRVFLFGSVVLLCNIVAYVSSAIAKRAVIKTKGNTLLQNDMQWLYVMSKPSAVVYIVCYLCLLIGGETLTLPQEIAFNTVLLALLGGLLVMAVRSIKTKMGVVGLSSLFIYAVVFFIFGLEATILVMSVTGLIAVFKYKPQEDKDICKK